MSVVDPRFCGCVWKRWALQEKRKELERTMAEIELHREKSKKAGTPFGVGVGASLYFLSG